jgi:hypothetical protein
MATCVACELDIDDDELTTADCGHEFHQDCLTQNVQQGFECQGCHPLEPLPESTATYESGDEGGEQEYPLADEPEPVTQAVTDTAVPVTDPVPDTTATDSPTAADNTADTAPDLAKDQAAAASRLRTAIDRADAALAAANNRITALTSAGATREAVSDAVETAGFADALAVCATTGNWAPSADAAAGWPATQEIIDDLNGASTSFEANAAVAESAQASLLAMTAVDLGPKVELTDTGEHNVADMALGGPSFQGYNLHPLTRDLAGWSSIRAEGGFVVIVRWSGTKLQVGATGKHIQLSGGDDYKLDDAVATSFVTKLACKRADGSFEIV